MTNNVYFTDIAWRFHCHTVCMPTTPDIRLPASAAPHAGAHVHTCLLDICNGARLFNSLPPQEWLRLCPHLHSWQPCHLHAQSQTAGSSPPLLLPSWHACAASESHVLPVFLDSEPCSLPLPCLSQAPWPSPHPTCPSLSVAQGEGCRSSAQNLQELSTLPRAKPYPAGWLQVLADPQPPQLLPRMLLLSGLPAGPGHSPSGLCTGPLSAPASPDLPTLPLMKNSTSLSSCPCPASWLQSTHRACRLAALSPKTSSANMRDLCFVPK